MKFRGLLALITVLIFASFFSLTTFAADWDLAQQGNLNITADGDYNIISTDKNRQATTTSNVIIIDDNINATITLNNVSIDTDKSCGLQIGNNANVTLNLIGNNSISNNADNKPTIENNGSSLTIVSECEGILKLQDTNPAPEISTTNISIDELLTLSDIDASRFVVVEEECYVLTDQNNIESDIEVGQGSIISIEVITDNPTPLSDSTSVLENASSITIDGNAQVVSGRDVYSKNNSYIIGFDTIINDIPGWDIESLGNHIPYQGDFSDLVLMVNETPLTNCRILKNKNKNITLIVSDPAESIKLIESKLKNKQLIDGIDAQNVLHSCNLNLGKNYKENFIIRFHLGETYAGKTVEVRSFENDKIVTENIVVSKSGIAAFAASSSGDFALISK